MLFIFRGKNIIPLREEARPSQRRKRDLIRNLE